MVKQKEYEKLELKDDFMFGKVMQNEAICKEFLEHLMDIKIDNITYPERQKSLKITSEGKGVRLDVYVQDDEDVIYDAEMQQKSKKERWRREYMKTLLHDEEVRQEGRSEGLREGRQEEIFISVQEGDYSVERGAQKLKLPVEDFTRQMESAGYCIPIK